LEAKFPPCYTDLMIRGSLKHFLINSAALYLVSLTVSGMSFENGIITLFLTGIALTLTTLIVRPLINILLLPINLVTFGFFRWVGFAIALYVVTLIIPDFKIVEFAFKGLTTYWAIIPPVYLSGILAFIAFSFVISFISSIVAWVLK